MPVPEARIEEVDDDTETENVEGELMEGIPGVAMSAKMAEAHDLEPQNLKEVMRSPDWPRWQEVMVEERMVLETFGTWRLKKLPPNMNIIGCHWTFVVKCNASGVIVRYHTCLIAQGFSQVPGVDFFETYALVAKMASMRSLLAMSACYDFEIHQIDIKSAYLNGEFEEGEIIYMHLPPGIHLTDDKSLVCCLLKPLYGLHQSGRHWYQKLWSVLMGALQMKKCKVDQAVFYRAEEEKLMMLAVHMDDCLVMASLVELEKEIKTELCRVFDISDLGEINWILGIAVKRDRGA
jgi:Reverse transcriptase (RNA-dependent DNA polymerase)